MNHLDPAADAIYRSQRTERGLHYQRYMSGLRALRTSGRTEDRDKCKRLDESVLRIRGVGPGQVHADQIMSTISVQYANDEFIGERLMPMVPVAKRSDSFAIYPKRERLAYPDDSLGERARATELSESRTLANYSVRDYGYQNYVDAETINNQDAAFDEMANLTDAINEGIAFRREEKDRHDPHHREQLLGQHHRPQRHEPVGFSGRRRSRQESPRLARGALARPWRLRHRGFLEPRGLQHPRAPSGGA